MGLRRDARREARLVCKTACTPQSRPSGGITIPGTAPWRGVMLLGADLARFAKLVADWRRFSAGCVLQQAVRPHF
jgi:hypothetical protein